MRAQSFYSLFLTSFFFVDLLASSVDDQPEHAWWKRGGHGRVRGSKNRKTRLVDQLSVARAKKKALKSAVMVVPENKRTRGGHDERRQQDLAARRKRRSHDRQDVERLQQLLPKRSQGKALTEEELSMCLRVLLKLLVDGQDAAFGTAADLTGVAESTLREKYEELVATQAMPEVLHLPRVGDIRVVLLEKVMNWIASTGFHAQNQIESACAAHGHEVYLSPYHPEFQPIEMLWSDVKGALSMLSTNRSIDELTLQAYSEFNRVNIDDCRKKFAHCDKDILKYMEHRDILQRHGDDNDDDSNSDEDNDIDAMSDFDGILSD